MDQLTIDPCSGLCRVIREAGLCHLNRHQRAGFYKARYCQSRAAEVFILNRWAVREQPSLQHLACAKTLIARPARKHAKQTGKALELSVLPVCFPGCPNAPVLALRRKIPGQINHQFRRRR
jgi:hypothetical protein